MSIFVTEKYHGFEPTVESICVHSVLWDIQQCCNIWYWDHSFKLVKSRGIKQYYDICQYTAD